MRNNKNIWRWTIAILFAVICSISVGSASTTYTKTYANAGDAPIYGTMIDPSGYYNSDHGIGSVAKPYGNALDLERVWIYDPINSFQMLKWDMGSKTNFIRVYPSIEHNDQLNWDYMQWSLYGSNQPCEDMNCWTLLYDPLTSSGSTVDDF